MNREGKKLTSSGLGGLQITVCAHVTGLKDGQIPFLVEVGHIS